MKLLAVVIPLASISAVAACGLTLGVDPADAGPEAPDVAPRPTATSTTPVPTRPDVFVPDGAPSIDGSSDADASTDAMEEASDSDASDASRDASPDATDAATDGRADASDGGSVLPAASISLRFEGLVAGQFPNDVDPAAGAVPKGAQSQADAPRGLPAPLVNLGSVRVAPDMKRWVKIDPAQAQVKVAPVTKLTVVAWVKPEATTGNATIVSFSSGAGETPLFELTRTSTDGLRFGVGELLSGTGTAANGVAAPRLFLAPGAWRFVAATYDKALGQACFYKGAAAVGGEATLDGCVAYANREFTPANDRDSAFVVGNSANEAVANPPGNMTYVPSFGGNLDQVFVFFGHALGLAEIRQVQSKN